MLPQGAAMPSARIRDSSHAVLSAVMSKCLAPHLQDRQDVNDLAEVWEEFIATTGTLRYFQSVWRFLSPTV
jgi:hypothetical protein